MKFGHLERLDITLKALSPVFIGSGERLTKKEYIFNPKKNIIYLPDFPLLIKFLKEKSLLPKYEKYLLHPRNNDLQAFLQENHVDERAYSSFVKYSIAAGEAAKVPNFREVLPFVKGPDGKPYFPGSSLKGAVRTALAAKLITHGNWEGVKRRIEAEADNYRNSRNYLVQENKSLEQNAFCRLDIKDPKDPAKNLPDPINDLMRGIQISDSAPIGYENLTLAGKYDRKPDGSFKILPIFRECLLPGSEARLVLTLDLSLLAKADIDLSYIENALHSFADEHYASFEAHFTEHSEDVPVAANQGVDIILGGGTGYVSKTLTYNLFTDRARSLPLTAKILAKQFFKHKHPIDVAVYKVSPHILKTTRYQSAYYQMGRCELIFN